MIRADLLAIMPRAAGVANVFLPHLNAAMREFGIVGTLDQIAFLANIAVESRDLTDLSENLNYSAPRLRVVWPKRFPTDAIAEQYARNPMKLANFVYANREGNGGPETGDGWLFRGAGLLQITFRNNHAKVAKRFGIPIEKVGDWLRTPEGACRAAAWFWSTAGCSKRMAVGDFDGACDLVNIGRKTETFGDAIGFGERLKVFTVGKVAMA